MTTTIRLAAVVVVLSILSGCGFVPHEQTSTLDQKQRENVSQKGIADFIRSTEPAPFTATIPQGDGKPPITVTVPPKQKVEGKAEASENSASENEGSKKDSDTIPLFVKLIGGAVGLAMLAAVVFGIIWFVRRSSAAANVAWKTGDEFIGRIINRFKTEAMASSDPVVSSRLTAAVADAERDRTVFNKD